MDHLVSITRQGQLTIPKSLRDVFGIHASAKALVRQEGDTIVVKPAANFWELAGSLKSSKVLSARALGGARRAFARDWARKQK